MQSFFLLKNRMNILHNKIAPTDLKQTILKTYFTEYNEKNYSSITNNIISFNKHDYFSH